MITIIYALTGDLVKSTLIGTIIDIAIVSYILSQYV